MREKLRMFIDLLGFYKNAKNYRSLNNEDLSVFVYDILELKPQDPLFEKIEIHRNIILRDTSEIDFTQYGAGDVSCSSTKVNALASSSLSPEWKCHVLYNLVSKLSHGSVIELGTSFGISTAYLACSSQQSDVYTIEGSMAVHDHANSFFSKMGFKNITGICGEFNVILSDLLDKIPEVGFAYIDGNHRKHATLEYFKRILKKCHKQSFIVIDDIYWSVEMKEAWADIMNHKRVSCTIDLFQMGIVMFDPGLNGNYRVIRRRYKPMC